MIFLVKPKRRYQFWFINECYHCLLLMHNAYIACFKLADDEDTYIVMNYLVLSVGLIFQRKCLTCSWQLKLQMCVLEMFSWYSKLYDKTLKDKGGDF